MKNYLKLISKQKLNLHKKDFPPGQLYRSSEKFDSTEFHNYQQQGLLLSLYSILFFSFFLNNFYYFILFLNSKFLYIKHNLANCTEKKNVLKIVLFLLKYISIN